MPSSSSTLVNVAEDAEQRLVQLLGQGSTQGGFIQACEQCLVNGDAAGLLKTIIGDNGAMSVLLGGDEALFSLLAALLDRVSSKDDESKLSTALATSIETSGLEVGKKIKLLSCLYNLRVESSEKCSLLAKMMAMATPAMLAEGQPLADIIEDTEPLLDTWEVQPSDRRKLYKAIAQTDESRKQRFTILLVQSYRETSEIDSDGLEAAKQAAIGAIQDPVTLFQEQRNMLTMPAIQALANSSETKELYSLLRIFQEGKLEDYRSFSGDLSTYGLNQDDCIRHMRILSLCSLAAEHEEVPYEVVASTLEVGADEVESWVIAAVSSGLLSAKMDQINKKILVERSVVRKFDMDQWKALQSQLHSWKKNLSDILQAFHQQDALSTAKPPAVEGSG